ncbi:MAG: fimbrillin family protein [Bacteroidales bacterium]|nr:fimbrillin family protein [Bacteroidales bacterium]
MKKYLILAAFAAVALGACTKVETEVAVNDELVPVTFSAYSGRSANTKANPIGTVAELAAQGGFGVFAYYTENSSYVPASSPINFMYNQHLTSTDDGANWTYNPIKYWPNNDAAHTNGATTTDRLSFFAYAPWVNPSSYPAAGITNVPANTGTGDPIVTYTVATNPANSVDFLWSDADNKNLTKQAVTGKVNFTFKHALTRLEFTVKGVFDSTTDPGTDDVDSATKIYVNSLEITTEQKIPASGTFNLNTGAWVTKTGEASLNIAAANIPDALKTGGAGVTKTETPLLNTNEYFMFIPNDVAQTYNFKINYSVITTDTALNGGNSTVVNEITKSASIKFEAGKAYKVKLDLGMTTVKISAEVATWGTVDDSNIVWLPVNL